MRLAIYCHTGALFQLKDVWPLCLGEGGLVFVAVSTTKGGVAFVFGNSSDGGVASHFVSQ